MLLLTEANEIRESLHNKESQTFFFFYTNEILPLSSNLQQFLNFQWHSSPRKSSEFSAMPAGQPVRKAMTQRLPTQTLAGIKN